jgi:hypothetical protein
MSVQCRRSGQNQTIKIYLIYAGHVNNAKERNGFIVCNDNDSNTSGNIDLNVIIFSILENIFTKARPTGAGRQFFTGNWYIYSI